MKKGVLLINLGTPDDCTPKAVRHYLKAFLNDERVVDMPYIVRKLLVNFIIIPLRYKKTAAAYQKIWSDQGSPLLANSEQLKKSLSEMLKDDYQVELGMRYGHPSIASAFNKLKGVDALTVIPLFPQYSSAANASAIQKFLECVKQEWNLPKLIIKNNFYDHPGYISAYAERIKKSLGDKKVDLLLFSYHGLPERHIKKSDCKLLCQTPCGRINADNLYCYRAQCYATADLIARELQLEEHQYAVSFQSRLGRTPWIKPYTDKLLPELIKKEVKNIAVVSPSFVADCLETLEEINLRLREQWRLLGGNQFIFVPCLNDSTPWVEALAKMTME